MGAVTIVNAVEANLGMIADAQNIFWETSMRSHFTDDEERQNFLRKYFQHYIDHYPEYFFLICEDASVLGYLALAPHTTLNEQQLKWFPFYQKFLPHLSQYPAHLHINFSAKARGRGLGSILIGHGEMHLKQKGIKGLHLITASGAKNVTFYLKNHYIRVDSTIYSDAELLFMAKEL